MSPKQALDIFVTRMSKRYHVSEEQIRSVLKKKFGSFNQAKVQQYERFLYDEFKSPPSVHDEKTVDLFVKQVEKIEEDYLFHFPSKCPYHPEATVTGRIRLGKSAWICSAGNMQCMHREKADRLAAKSGTTIDWVEFDEFLSDGGGDIEAFAAWRKGRQQ